MAPLLAVQNGYNQQADGDIGAHPEGDADYNRHGVLAHTLADHSRHAKTDTQGQFEEYLIKAIRRVPIRLPSR